MNSLHDACTTGTLADLNATLKFTPPFKLLSEGTRVLKDLCLFGGRKDGVAKLDRLLQIESIREKVSDSNNHNLLMASVHGHLDIVNRLLEEESVRLNVSCKGNKILIEACGNGRIEIVNRLLQIDSVRALIATNDNEALRVTCKCRSVVLEDTNYNPNGHYEVVKRLLQEEAVISNAHALNNEALNNALSKGNSAIAKELLKIDSVINNISVNDEPNSALSDACYRGDLAIIDLLLQNPKTRFNSSVDNLSLIKTACSKGQFEVFSRLFSNEEIYRVMVLNSQEILMFASRGGNIDIMKRLLQVEEIVVSIKDIKALHYACRAGNTGIVDYLMQVEFFRSHAADNNNKALQLANDYEHLDVVEILIKNITVQASFNIEHYDILRKACLQNHYSLILKILDLPSFKFENQKVQDYLSYNQEVETNFNVCLGLALIQDMDFYKRISPSLNAEKFHQLMMALLSNFEKLSCTSIEIKANLPEEKEREENESVKLHWIFGSKAKSTKNNDYLKKLYDNRNLNIILKKLCGLYLKGESLPLLPEKPAYNSNISADYIFQTPFIQTKNKGNLVSTGFGVN